MAVLALTRTQAQRRSRPGGATRAPAPLRALLVAAYTVVFWGVLPAGLWKSAALLDRQLGFVQRPEPSGWLLLFGGGALLSWAMHALWLGGGGLPVSALPPPFLTRRGPYRNVRHPIYLGFQIGLFGAGLVVGSCALTTIVAPAFIPIWLAYAWLEERALVRRFGSEYRRYRRQVGVLPRLGAYRASQLLQALRVLDVDVTGREHVPRVGPAILVFNHTSYLDAAMVGTVTLRIVHHMTTAEVYRGGPLSWLVRRYPNVPVRRYRPDPVACRELVRLLADGELVGIAPEGERAVLGGYQGAPADVARMLARLGAPVIPIGLSGAYDVGPRWSDVLRRRNVRVRVGPPVVFAGRDPAEAIDTAILALIDEDAERVDLAGLSRAKLERVLWRCPRCGEEDGWDAPGLACKGCKLLLRPTGEGWFSDEQGTRSSLRELGERMFGFVERDELEARASGAHEPSIFGPLAPLVPIGIGELVVSRAGISFGAVEIPLAEIRRTSTERANTLQIATADDMWQFRLDRGSVFRLKLALDRWRKARHV